MITSLKFSRAYWSLSPPIFSLMVPRWCSAEIFEGWRFTAL